MRKEGARGDGKRKPIAESDEDDDQKKTEVINLPQNDIVEDTKEKETRELVIRAAPNQQITQILQQYNISLSQGAKGASGGISEQK